MTFFAPTLLKDIAALRSFFIYVFGPLKMPHKKIGKDWTVVEEVMGDLARALPDGQTDRKTNINTQMHTKLFVKLRR